MFFLDLQNKYSYVWKQILRFRWEFIPLAAVLLLQILVSVAIPIPAKKLLNEVMHAKAENPYPLEVLGLKFGTMSTGDALTILVMISVGIGLVSCLLGWIELFWASEIKVRVQRNIREDMLQRLFTRTQRYLDSKRKIDLLGRISSDTENIEILLENGLSAVLRDIPMICVLVAVMFHIHPQLTLLVGITLLAYYALGKFFNSRNRVATRHYRRSVVAFEEDLMESASSMAIAKSLGGDRKLLARLIDRVQAVTKSARNQRKYGLGLDTGISALGFIVVGTMYYVGGRTIFSGGLGLGDLFQMFAYMQIMQRHIDGLNKFVTKLPKCQASLDRVCGLDEELRGNPEISGTLTALPAIEGAAASSISFRDVSFAYESGEAIFRNFSIDFPAGALVGLVGRSGTGKSSFSRLLNRLHEPSAGRILLGGTDLREFDLHALRKFVRVISQDNFLISGTVRENLLLAVSGAKSDGDLWAALAAAGAADFVGALPQGLEEIIGESGAQLSGGQAKRIHLARAFLDEESRVLVLDEPTSGLDSSSAAVVMDSIKRLSRRKSLIFWITHQMSELRMSDRVLFLDRGIAPAFAPHEELFEKYARYRGLASDGGESFTRPESVTTQVDLAVAGANA